MKINTRMTWVWAILLVLCIVSNMGAHAADQWAYANPTARVAASTDSSIAHEFFPLHVGDTWVYGYSCTYSYLQEGRTRATTKQEGTLTRVITHIDTIGEQAYYMTQDIAQPDSVADGLIANFQWTVHSNYRVDTNGNVYAYEPRFGVELLVFRLNAQPGDEWWLEHEGELPEAYYLGSWINESVYNWSGEYIGDYMEFAKYDPEGIISYGGANLRRAIGIVGVSSGGDFPEVDCRFQLLQAVIDGQEYVLRTAVQETTWGDLKSSFSAP